MVNMDLLCLNYSGTTKMSSWQGDQDGVIDLTLTSSAFISNCCWDIL